MLADLYCDLCHTSSTPCSPSTRSAASASGVRELAFLELHRKLSVIPWLAMSEPAKQKPDR